MRRAEKIGESSHLHGILKKRQKCETSPVFKNPNPYPFPLILLISGRVNSTLL